MRHILILLTISCAVLVGMYFDQATISVAAQETGVTPNQDTPANEWENAQAIGVAAGLIVAASLALQAALGPAMNSIVEAIRATGWFAGERTSGVISLVIGTILGTAAGWLALEGTGGGDPMWIGVGAFAGLIGLGTGGVRSRLVIDGYQFQRLAAELSERKRTDAILALTVPAADAEETLVVENLAVPDSATGGPFRRRTA